jgi:hypothetical protein
LWRQEPVTQEDPELGSPDRGRHQQRAASPRAAGAAIPIVTIALASQCLGLKTLASWPFLIPCPGDSSRNPVLSKPKAEAQGHADLPILNPRRKAVGSPRQPGLAPDHGAAWDYGEAIIRFVAQRSRCTRIPVDCDCRPRSARDCQHCFQSGRPSYSAHDVAIGLLRVGRGDKPLRIVPHEHRVREAWPDSVVVVLVVPGRRENLSAVTLKRQQV